MLKIKKKIALTITSMILLLAVAIGLMQIGGFKKTAIADTATNETTVWNWQTQWDTKTSWWADHGEISATGTTDNTIDPWQGRAYKYDAAKGKNNMSTLTFSYDGLPSLTAETFGGFAVYVKMNKLTATNNEIGFSYFAKSNGTMHEGESIGVKVAYIRDGEQAIKEDIEWRKTPLTSTLSEKDFSGWIVIPKEIFNSGANAPLPIPTENGEFIFMWNQYGYDCNLSVFRVNIIKNVETFITDHTPALPEFTYVFNSENGTTLETIVKKQGETVTPAVPTFTNSFSRTERFVGWKDSLNKLYAPDLSIVASANETFTAVFADFYMAKGASIRLTGESGLRFTVNLAAATKAKVEALDSTIVYGINIVREGSPVEKDVIAENIAKNEANDYYFNAVIKNILKNHYDLKYTAQGYMKITYADNTDRTITAVANDNKRCISYIAACAKIEGTQNPTKYTVAEMAIIETYITAAGQAAADADIIYANTFVLSSTLKSSYNIGETIEFQKNSTRLTNCAWKTTNAAIATVSEIGVVNAIAEGSVTITCVNETESKTLFTHTFIVTNVAVSPKTIVLDSGYNNNANVNFYGRTRYDNGVVMNASASGYEVKFFGTGLKAIMTEEHCNGSIANCP